MTADLIDSDEPFRCYHQSVLQPVLPERIGVNVHQVIRTGSLFSPALVSIAHDEEDDPALIGHTNTVLISGQYHFGLHSPLLS